MSLPLEAVYLDQKHMNLKSNFMLNEELISNITALRFVLDTYNTKLVAFIDAAVYAPEDTDVLKAENPTYFDGLRFDTFIKSTHKPNSTYSNNLLGLRGLKKCVYVDWFNQDKSTVFWFQ
jgi:alpha-glucosidase (family GH31 glycosyl hydrolase)